MLNRVDAVWTQGTHVVFRNMGPSPIGKTKWTKTNVYEVVDKGSSLLGRISWFGRWRKYAFMPNELCVFEETCLREISQFIEEETKAHRAKKTDQTRKDKEV